MKSNGKIKTAVILMLICVFIAAIPIVIHKNSEFTGSDDAGVEAILEINPNYKVWAKPILEVEGKESLPLCLQAILGIGGLTYGFIKLKKRS